MILAALSFSIHSVSARHASYGLLALLVGGESMGLFLPGETALIAATVLAHGGGLQILTVIAVAAGAAIVGDNIGYALGRSGARSLLLAHGPFARHRARLLARGERFFARYGAKTVFLGRWVPFLRITAAWLAGASRMPWPVFASWNAAGCVAWATSVGVAGYALGAAVTGALSTFVFVVVTLAAIVSVLTHRRRERFRTP